LASYVKSTNFASKDTLPLGDPLKIVKGTEIDTEFNNIAVAVGTKADLISPTFTGVPAAPTPDFTDPDTTIATMGALKLLYPIGSVYINAAVTTNPATLLGFGTWTEIGSGRVLVGQDTGDTTFDVMGETGGSKDAIVVSHTHTGTTNTTGAHAHGYTDMGGNNQGGTAAEAYSSGTFTFKNTSRTTDSAGDHSHTLNVNSTGSSGTNANLQPYVVVKMWQRSA
jgi:hypothetical protein